MRAVQVVQTTGPAGVRVVDVPEPEPGPGDVLIDVHAVGVSFPDLLLSKGLYQLRPDPPFTLGVDLAGTVLATGAEVARDDLVPGARVAGVVPHGGAGERAVVPAGCVFALLDSLSYDEGAALPMNYLTAHFALQRRGRVGPGETVLVHGASGGVGTAGIQVARGLGARTIGVVSTSEKAAAARAAGAHEVVMLEGFKEAVRTLTGGRGVDVVLDMVGGDAFTDSLRSLAEEGRLLVVGFAAGHGIPEVKVNRLLLGNIDVRGVGWGAFALGRPEYLAEQWSALLLMVESGVVRPPVHTSSGLAGFAQALADLDHRRATGKSVVRVQ